jgi:hypothetical protein
MISMKNARPVGDGWGPFPSLAEYSNALPAAPKGSVYVRDSSGNFKIIAGTASGLYELNTSTLNWDEISKSATPYNVPDADQWQFQRFGDYLYATNVGDPLQRYNIETPGNFADVSGSPPQAKYIWTAGDFLVLGNLQNNPSRLQWSGLNDATHWTVGEKGSDFQDMPDGQDIAGGIREPQGALVIQRKDMHYMRFNPASGYTFTFSVANPERGSVAPLSITQVGPGDFVYLTEDGFFRGVEGRPIGEERVDRWFLDTQLDLSNISLVVGVADPFSKIVWFQFQDNTTASYLLGYKWTLDRWCYADNNVSDLAALTTAGVTLEGLDSFSSSIDALETSLDSRVWKGGRPTFGGFTTDYKLGYFNGPNREAQFETAEVDLARPSKAFVQGCRVFTDADDYTVEVAGSDYHGDTPVYDNPASPNSKTGITPMRNEARLHKFRVTIAAGDVWENAMGVDPQFVPSGDV